MTTDQHLNTAAMALGALPDDEALEYADHLVACPTCAAELTSFLETASMLGSSVAQTPPASLRRSVMAEVARTAQLPPLTGDDSELGRHRRAAESEAGTAQAGGIVDADDRIATVIPIHRAWYRRPQAILAAAVAVLIIGGGTTLVLDRHSPAPQSAAACVAAASDKTEISRTTTGTGGSVTVSPSCDTAVVTVPTLPTLAAGKVYQLWVIKGDSATSAGVLSRNADGSYAAVDAKVHLGDSSVGLTVEPSPGSVKPTSNPIWAISLNAA